MNFLDVIVLPFSGGDSATIIFAVGALLGVAVCVVTGILLTQHFQKERQRVDRRKEKRMLRDEE